MRVVDPRVLDVCRDARGAFSVTNRPRAKTKVSVFARRLRPQDAAEQIFGYSIVVRESFNHRLAPPQFLLRRINQKRRHIELRPGSSVASFPSQRSEPNS